MLTEPVLSIIVPAFNAGKTIETCLDCLSSQSLQNLEILVVDDCSMDDTRDKVWRCVRDDQRIRLIPLDENRGSGYARNVGIEASVGKYLGFCDADDWMDGDAYRKMVEGAGEANAEIAMCGIKTEWGNFRTSSARYSYPQNQVLHGRQGLRAFTRSIDWDVQMSAIVNNRIYLSSLVNDNRVRFNDTRNAQDNFFSFFALLYCRRIALIPGVHYHYLQREDSISHCFDESYIDGLVNALKDIRDELFSRGLYADYEDEFHSLVNRCMGASMKNMFARTPSFESQRQLAKYLLKRFIDAFGFDELFDYLDTEAIRRLFR